MKVSGHTQDHPRRGVLLIVGGVFLLALADALVKSLSEHLSLWQLFVLAPLISLPVLATGWRLQGTSFQQGRSFQQGLATWVWIGLRSSLLLAMWIAFYAALPWVPLSVAAVGIYTTPLFIAVLAAWAGESLSGRQCLALLIGFGGVMIVLRPGSDVFSPAMLLPLLAALCYAGAMVLTRRRCRDVNAWLLALGLNVAFLLAGLVGNAVLLVWHLDSPGLDSPGDFLGRAWQPLDAREVMLIALYAVLMVVVNTAVARAYQIAPSALVGIFDYAYLIFAAGWGFWLFDEIPDTATLIGMATILIAGGLALRKRKD